MECGYAVGALSRTCVCPECGAGLDAADAPSMLRYWPTGALTSLRTSLLLLGASSLTACAFAFFSMILLAAIQRSLLWTGVWAMFAMSIMAINVRGAHRVLRLAMRVSASPLYSETNHIDLSMPTGDGAGAVRANLTLAIAVATALIGMLIGFLPNFHGPLLSYCLIVAGCVTGAAALLLRCLSLAPIVATLCRAEGSMQLRKSSEKLSGSLCFFALACLTVIFAPCAAPICCLISALLNFRLARSISRLL
jgi:hypothetical protein